MRKIRVLVVDDSTVIRRLLTDALAGEEGIEVVGSAANGRIALSKIALVNPDLITLDIEMPVLDGLETLKTLRTTYPKLPVVMFSTLTERGAIATLNALSLGANDYVTKPANVGSVVAGIQRVREDLVPKIRALCGQAAPPAKAAAGIPRSWIGTPPANRILPVAGRRVELVTIGVSTGGPNALTEVFRALPGNLRVPVLVVQHMPPVFTKYLAQRLDAVSPLEVTEAAGGELLAPGRAWLAPGNFHLALQRTAQGVVTKLTQSPPENSCRPAVDVLFRSAAELYGAGVLGVVLTGMGADGVRGSECSRQEAGRVLAQDEATSVVWGMPGAVAGAGLASEVLPLSAVAARIVQLVGSGVAERVLATCKDR
jgi:two-component system chemotaxis response regulator CheB